LSIIRPDVASQSCITCIPSARRHAHYHSLWIPMDPHGVHGSQTGPTGTARSLAMLSSQQQDLARQSTGQGTVDLHHRQGSLPWKGTFRILYDFTIIEYQCMISSPEYKSRALYEFTPSEAIHKVFLLKKKHQIYFKRSPNRPERRWTLSFVIPNQQPVYYLVSPVSPVSNHQKYLLQPLYS